MIKGVIFEDGVVAPDDFLFFESFHDTPDFLSGESTVFSDDVDGLTCIFLEEAHNFFFVSKYLGFTFLWHICPRGGVNV